MPSYNPRLTAIDRRETRRYAGLTRAAFDEEMIAAACEEATLLAAPRAVWQEYAYDCRRGAARPVAPAENADEFLLAGDAVKRHLAGCRAAIILAATVGLAFDREIDRHFQDGEYTRALLLDAAATAAVEQAADELEKELSRRAAREGKFLRPRFSPGYGDWPLTAQPDMVRLSGAANIGITLTEALMLLPRKSITAVIGLADTPSTEQKTDCATCPRQNCPSRKTPPG